MTVAFQYVLVLPATKPPDAIMYKSNPHAVRVWHHCRAEIETTTQFYPHPQRGFNKLPEDAFYSLIQRMTLARLSGDMANIPGCISRGRLTLCCCRFQLNKCVCISNTNPRRAAGKKNGNFGSDIWSEISWEEMQLPALSRNTHAGKLQGNLQW